MFQKRHNRIQNEVAEAAIITKQEQNLEVAQRNNKHLELDGFHRYVKIGKGCSNLRLLCRIDADGELVPEELVRIEKVKRKLNIK